MTAPTTINDLHHHYRDWVRAHPAAAEDFTDAIEDLLVDAGVTYDRVTCRVKKWRSLKTKATSLTPGGELFYRQPWKEINDIVGVRVTTFCSTEIPQVIEVLREAFTVLKSVDKTAQTRISGSFGYGSHHLICRIDTAVDGLADYAGFTFEVQIRTVLQHAWAEFEHDIRYKRGSAVLDPRIDRAFTLTAGLIELADQQFDQIAAIQDGGVGASHDVQLTAETLPGVLAVLVGNRFPRSKSEYYGWLEEILALNGITTVGELKDLLDDRDISAVQQSMRYRFVPGQVRLIDDLLLRRFGADHIIKTKHTGMRAKARAERLPARLEQMRIDGIVDDSQLRADSPADTATQQ
ncbi:GTP pyrophosphokinase family protein [Corynebacterium mendelii]|uniref:GTP pyrophosphokinase family protein n=1 Tax=Corynebacterium mendelii TaxID=2765362 RepID=A0A939DYL8_9CORY|nr:GTP pyrophosphokinase family protein [Corynebacterium mendelii]MBN9643629.1 GTP pyrophosphokinase family protein [Corynebacterium mendelii]